MTEAEFSKELKTIAPKLGCRWKPILDDVKIPLGDSYVGFKRPFDGILVTPDANFLIELKMNYNPLRDHQKEFLYDIYYRNSKAFVLRMIDKTKTTKYRLDKIILSGLNFDKEVILETTELNRVFDFLKSENYPPLKQQTSPGGRKK